MTQRLGNEDALALTPAEVVARTRVGRGTVYAALASGELRCVRIGNGRRKRIVVPVEAVQEWLDRLSEPATS